MAEEDPRERFRKKQGRMNRAGGSNSNGSGWKQRKIETITCPSGEKVQIRRPGPDFMLRARNVARTFTKALTQKAQVVTGDLPLDEAGLKFLDSLSDDELTALLVFGREIVCAMMVSPRLVQNPQPGTDEVGPDDIGDDFWFLFTYAMNGFFNLAVPVGTDQEVKISDLESFRSESGISGDSDNGPEVRTDAEQPSGDQGLVDSAGA